MKDSFGNPVGTTDARAVAAFERAMRGVLSHARTTMADLDEAVECDGNFALAHATRGLLMLTLARRELTEPARSAHRAAICALSATGGSPRETAYVAALGEWLEGRPEMAGKLLDGNLRINPQDSLALKLVHAIRFMCGDQAGMRASIDCVIDRIAPDHPHLGYILGCRSFALEETGDYEAAERTGRRGVELAPDDAWGIHAVAHVCEMTHRPEDGIGWVAGKHENWASCNNFRHHLFWHMALFHLDRKDIAKVVELYDRHVHDADSDDFRDISNSASLLARLQFEGFTCERRWRELADLAERRMNDDALAFADLHYMIALDGAGRSDKADLIAERMGRSEAICCVGGRADRELAAGKTASGLHAFMAGDYSRAFDSLSLALPALVQIGGSHAQRDVFVRFAIEAGIRAHRWSDTRQLVERRIRRHGAADNYARDRLAVIEKAEKAIPPVPAAAGEPALYASAWY